MDSDAGCLSGAALLILLLLFDFIMTAFASALHNISDAELQPAFSEQEKPPDEISTLRDQCAKLKHTCWLLHAVTYVGAGFFCSHLSERVSPWLLLPALMILFYLAGNSVPEMLGRKNAVRWVTRRYRLAGRILALLSPFTFVMTALSDLCVRLLGIDPRSLEQEVTEDEIISMVNEGHEQGVLDAREAEMIQNIFELDDKNAGDIMTHRKNIIGISGATNLRDAISFMVGEPVSRYPVYDGSIEYITGILHFKDAMKFHTMEKYDSWLIKDIPGLLRTARFIPETRGINLLFRSMQAEHLQMVIVVDEYGETAGLVAMEDILEEIVGNIQDEYDKDVQLIRGDADNGYLMDGMAPLSEVKDTLEITLEDEEYDTLNGLLISRLDRIPADGERFEIMAYGYLFQILKVENKMIRLVRITKSKEEEKE